GLNFAGEVEIPRFCPRELARAGAGEGAGRDEFDDAVDARDRPDPVADFVAEAAAFLGVGGAALDEDGRGLFAAGGGDRESGDVARLEAGELLDRPFDVLRPM